MRPWLPWSVPLLLIAAVLAAGLPFGGWRSPIEVLHSTDPVALLFRLRPGPGPVSMVAMHWLSAAVLGFAVGGLTWLWRGATPGIGFFAACAGFSLSLLIEVGRWFKPDHLPDFHDPVIAAVAAPAMWLMLRFLPVQPVTPLPRHGPWRTRFRVLLRFGATMGLVGCAVVLACGVAELMKVGLTPGTIARTVATLPDGRAGTHGAIARVMSGTFERIGAGPWLAGANRLDPPDDLAPPAWSGSGPQHDGVLPDGRLRSVNTTETLRQAVDSAVPGDVILLQPGTYRIQSKIMVTRSGTADAPITVRAPGVGSVVLESVLPEALNVGAPYWHFENLVLRGVCADDMTCDNGFHIVGAADHTVLRNLRVEDFNAQIKINGENGHFPDDGLITHVTLIDTHARRDDASVTPIDLVAASRWTIEDNLIADFVKTGGNKVSYGAYAKGAGRGTVFNRNVVLCTWHLRGPTSASIGLSFGGGGTGQLYFRDYGLSGYEQADGVMTDNLIAFCSAEGIYLNRAANSVIRHNTLIGTGGIDVRFPETIAQVDGNIVDGPIYARDNSLLITDSNETASLGLMFLGKNPVRTLFMDPARLDLRWRHVPVMVETAPGEDLCGADWSALSPAGAFRDFRVCGDAEKSGG